jgi:2-dehydro-3-deoxyphosphogluconate aldolase / (4S)-4-hydroxy-2-oxoglutarate aldolase
LNRAIDAIQDCRVIAILRAPKATFFAAAADVLVAHGLRAVEFALTTEGSLEVLKQYCASAPPDACVGAGTVLTAGDARSAAAAGARYLVSPAFIPEVIEAGAGLGVPVIAGALTPTEILTAYTAGAQLVKIFPAALAGPGYLRLLRDPLPQVPLVPTGGVGLADASEYLDAGALAVGMGSQLLGDSLRSGDLGNLAERAGQLVRAVRQGTAHV